MAAPWFETQSRVEDGTNLLEVFDIKPDWNVGQTYDNNIIRPITARDIPQAGALWTEPGFSSRIAGSGAAGTAPPEGTLFKAAGMAESVAAGVSVAYRWGPSHATTAVTALSHYIGNGLKQTSGNALLDVTFEFRPNQPLIARWTGAGTYTTPTEAAGSDTLGTKAVPLILKDTTATLATDSIQIREADIMLNNTLNSPNLKLPGSSSNGVDSPDLVDSTPTISILFEVPAFSVQNYHTSYEAGTALALSWVIGSAAGNILTITGTFYLNAHPVVEYVNQIAYYRVTADMGYDVATEILLFTFT